ncbi:MAG: hypothetical protein HQ567_30730 [Candidatus Nealsonbacteria bacterium]|nr:hypothetical protein [Candidatus Nealsonbacteria bacterium]
MCNFDEFWVYDFETQMDSPVDRLRIEELPQRWGPLAFLFPTPEKPVFGNDHEEVTRKAADRLATCFNKLVVRGVDRPEAGHRRVEDGRAGVAAGQPRRQLHRRRRTDPVRVDGPGRGA